MAIGTRAATPATPQNAQAWLSAVPPLPATAEQAYSQWTDFGGSVLRPGPAFQKVTDGLRARQNELSRPFEASGAGGGGSAHDQALVPQITLSPSTSTVEQAIQAVRKDEAALLQKWRGELGTLEQRRLEERSALPACRNGPPSQLAIRDVERAYSQQKIAIAARYLTEVQPLVARMSAAIAARVERGDAAMSAWNQLRNQGIKAQLAPAAHGAEIDALQDVESLQNLIKDVSQMAARSEADRKALERVYAQAGGC
jgi:hypothetical protein